MDSSDVMKADDMDSSFRERCILSVSLRSNRRKNKWGAVIWGMNRAAKFAAPKSISAESQENDALVLLFSRPDAPVCPFFYINVPNSPQSGHSTRKKSNRRPKTSISISSADGRPLVTQRAACCSLSQQAAGNLHVIPARIMAGSVRLVARTLSLTGRRNYSIQLPRTKANGRVSDPTQTRQLARLNLRKSLSLPGASDALFSASSSLPFARFSGRNGRQRRHGPRAAASIVASSPQLESAHDLHT